MRVKELRYAGCTAWDESENVASASLLGSPEDLGGDDLLTATDLTGSASNRETVDLELRTLILLSAPAVKRINSRQFADDQICWVHRSSSMVATFNCYLVTRRVFGSSGGGIGARWFGGNEPNNLGLPTSWGSAGAKPISA